MDQEAGSHQTPNLLVPSSHTFQPPHCGERVFKPPSLWYFCSRNLNKLTLINYILDKYIISDYSQVWLDQNTLHLIKFIYLI